MIFIYFSIHREKSIIIRIIRIAAIRVLNRLFNEEHLKGRKKKIQFIILTTSILNSKKILENLGKEVKSILNMKMFNDEMAKLDEK